MYDIFSYVSKMGIDSEENKTSIVWFCVTRHVQGHIVGCDFNKDAFLPSSGHSVELHH